MKLKGPKSARYLPESTAFEFLLNSGSPILKTIEEYLLIYSDITLKAFWDGKNYITIDVYRFVIRFLR